MKKLVILFAAVATLSSCTHNTATVATTQDSTVVDTTAVVADSVIIADSVVVADTTSK